MADKNARIYEKAFEEALLIRAFQDTIIRFLDESDPRMTRAALAAAMEVSEGRVSQILSGRPNLTVGTLAAVSYALGARFEIQLIDRDKSDLVNEFAMDGEDAGSLFSDHATSEMVSATGSRGGVRGRLLPSHIGKRAARAG